MRQRQEELGPRSGAHSCGHSAPSGSASSPEASTTAFVLVGVHRADRVDDRPARLHALRSRPQELELKLGQRARAPAEVGSPCEDAEPRARRIDERAVEPALVELAQVAGHDPHVRRAFRARASRPRPGCSSTAVTSPCSIAVLPPGAAQASRIRSPGCEPTTSASELRRAAHRPHPRRIDPLHHVGARDVGGLADGLGGTYLERRGLVLGTHQRERLVSPEVALPDLRDPVGIRELERPFGQRRNQPSEAVSRAAA